MGLPETKNLDPLAVRIKEREERNDNRRNRFIHSKRRRTLRKLRETSIPLVRRLDTKGIGDPDRGIVGIVIKGRKDIGNRYLRLKGSEPAERNEHYAGQNLNHANWIVPTATSILDYFGFKGRERETFLASFGDKSYTEGVLNAAYHLARYFGLNNIEERAKELFGAIAYSVHKRGTDDTDIFISSVGLKNLVHLENYKTMNIGGKTSLVQEEGLEMLTIREGTLPLGSPLGPSLMRKNGYSARSLSGIVVYSLKNS